MTLQQTDNYIKACMYSWLVCEACIHAENQLAVPDNKLLKVWTDCGQSCISIVARFMNDPMAVQKHAFDCYLYCRECYNECIRHQKANIELCAEVCDNCAELIKEIMFLNLN